MTQLASEQMDAMSRLERAPVALLRVSIELQNCKVSRTRWALVAFVLLGLVVLLGATVIALLYG